MEPSAQIRAAMRRVAELRTRTARSHPLSRAVVEIKQLQADRFSGTYPDLLQSPEFSPCAHFFLKELYSARDYSQRDQQFARVASAIELSFPDQVVAVTVRLAQLHQLTEELDLAMATCWADIHAGPPARRYLQAWRAVGATERRQWQLDSVMAIGEALGTLTRKRGLRLLLKMMRRPASLAGLADLQAFLEAGFDHFGGLAKSTHAVSTFLSVIRERETRWIERLNTATPAVCEAEIAGILTTAARNAT